MPAAPGSWALALLVLGSTRTAAAGVLKVEMAGSTQTVFLNDNIAISCNISSSVPLDINVMGVRWFWRNQTSKDDIKLFESFGDHEETFRPGAFVSPERLKEGNASLQLPRVQVGEEGEFLCEVVVTPYMAQGRIFLQVLAYPNGTLRENGDNHYLCELSGFYPEPINVTWKIWRQKSPYHLEIFEDVNTGHPIKNLDGTFNITSSLKLNSSLEDQGAFLQCVVEHLSLSTPLRLNYTQTVIEPEKMNIWWFCMELTPLILFFALFPWQRCRGARGNVGSDVFEKEKKISLINWIWKPFANVAAILQPSSHPYPSPGSFAVCSSHVTGSSEYNEAEVEVLPLKRPFVSSHELLTLLREGHAQASLLEDSRQKTCPSCCSSRRQARSDDSHPAPLGGSEIGRANKAGSQVRKKYFDSL
ncbi:natural cytotoxicity triggering receptor 3 ligand 1 [Carlito syrichta]|uniref:Natural cytotoxicity triggering receptor 3 ligand 1 n=1 Tax=Carlito syrichta TaxID=1868482 RepID=A0A3Q0ELG2_CARSF|nr:natural cytotoxicity triggering receptor 3 ligand 1 [Carlito syrichta]